MERPASNEYPIHELIRRRWSPTWFADRAVEQEELLSILEAGRWMASSYNEQPWRYIVALRQNAQQFATALGCLVPPNQAWARSAAVLVLTLFKPTFTHNDNPNRVALHDIGGASAAITFQAMSLGLFVHQMAGIERDKIIQTYKVPEGFEPATGFAMGYPFDGDCSALDEKVRKAFESPRTRKPMSEYIFADRFGQPAQFLAK